MGDNRRRGAIVPSRLIGDGLSGRLRRRRRRLWSALLCAMLAFLTCVLGSFWGMWPSPLELVEATRPLLGHKDVTPTIMQGTMGIDFDVRTNGIRPSVELFSKVRYGFPNLGESTEALATPEPWDSNLCMSYWERPELQREVDPVGYVVFVNGMEQLGGNKYLVADGAFMAKSLNRTLVEYPVKDARISVANATLGLGSYWDLSAVCMYHRILDQEAFRALVERGDISPESFVTLYTGHNPSAMQHFKRPEHVINYFQEYEQFKVIVMDHTWKSRLDRGVVHYLRPNPFYLGIVRMLLSINKEWADGNFMSVQWRTETATGNMTECYDLVREVVEDRRLELGLSRYQVLVTTDMFGVTSGTYKVSKKKSMGSEVLRRIREDYPNALDNALHRFFDRIEDSGVKAMVSGLVVAFSKVMVASSLNDPWMKNIPEAGVCQKPYSGYVNLIADWRTQIFRKSPDTVVRLFPFNVEDYRSGTSGAEPN